MKPRSPTATETGLLLPMSPDRVAVGADEIALVDLGQQTSDVAGSSESRYWKALLRWITMIEVHDIWRKGPAAVGARILLDRKDYCLRPLILDFLSRSTQFPICGQVVARSVLGAPTVATFRPTRPKGVKRKVLFARSTAFHFVGLQCLTSTGLSTVRSGSADCDSFSQEIQKTCANAPFAGSHLWWRRPTRSAALHRPIMVAVQAAGRVCAARAASVHTTARVRRASPASAAR